MGWLERLAARGGSPARPRFDGTSGRPPSGNGASSFHLFWDAPRVPWVAAEVVLEIVEPPTVPDLYFWALQVDLGGPGGAAGGAHLGLQWYPIHPGSTAVNWGGYGADGRELAGGGSALPSTPGNANTRDFAWVPGRAYRLRVTAHPGGGPRGLTAWRGEVDDLAAGRTTLVRDLWAPGDTIVAAMVWSEVFAACDDPPAAARWSSPVLTDAGGGRTAVTTATVNYQAVRDGGCSRTSSDLDTAATGWLQRTGPDRRTPAGTRLRLGSV